jgi:hypothetical protein
VVNFLDKSVPVQLVDARDFDDLVDEWEDRAVARSLSIFVHQQDVRRAYYVGAVMAVRR